MFFVVAESGCVSLPPPGAAAPPWLGGGGWGAVGVQGAAVGAGGGDGAVGVQGDAPAPPVDRDQMVEGAQVEQVGQAGGAALGAGDDVVRLAGGGGLGAAGEPAVPVPDGDGAAQTSDAVKLSSCSGKFCVGCGECGGFVVVLAGGQAVVQAAEQPSEQVALGGSVPVSVGFAPVIVGSGAG